MPGTDHPGPWWREAVIYQIYVRSFADGNGDGIGDLAGIRARLPYLRDLGVDAIWITPWYRSPMADGGYDVADYRDIDPRFGSLTEAEQLIGQAHANGLRVLIDIVPNHTSDQHDWFQQALQAAPGSPERARYWFRPGRGEHGERPPNNWQSRFGGPAWSRTTHADGTAGEWYLHLYTPAQPDLNWDNPQVRAEFESILRFWLDRGVDGFRIDVAHGLAKHPELPDLAKTPDGLDPLDLPGHPYRDVDAVHDIHAEWRRIADGYDGDRTFVAEAWVTNPERLARYVADGRLHTAFNFNFLQAPWDARRLREVIDRTTAAHCLVGAPATWVLSNHDVVRHVTRYGREHTSFEDSRREYATPLDLERGTRRARAAALLMLALPGGASVYQGEELGLEEVEDLPEAVRQDPARLRSPRCRDGSRVPLPWSGDSAPFGFSPPGATAPPWLPQRESWKDRTAERQAADPNSMLSLYSAALRLRRDHPALGDGTLAWQDAPAGVLCFRRDPGFACVVNLSTEPVNVPAGEVVLISASLRGGLLPPDTAVWLRVPGNAR